MPKIGDRVVVYGRMETPVYIEDLQEDLNTSTTILILNWGHFGKSKVYLHDKNKTWYLYHENI